MSRYVERVVDREIADLLAVLPAISVEGPKAVGKTETARRLARTVHALDDPAQRAVAAADPSRLVEGTRPVLLDEWQRVPDCWDVVRRAIDQDPAPSQFLLTGSASPTRRPTHSGAGRIVTVRMRPLSLAERQVEVPSVSLGALLAGAAPPLAGHTAVGLARYAEEIVASGFPGLRHLSGRPLRAMLDGYLARIQDTDVVEVGHRPRNPQALRRWMTAYAAATATTATYEAIRDAATSGEGDKPAKTTTLPYREALERLWILDPVPAWLPSRSPISRLTHPPKHHLTDPALAARLLGLDAEALLGGEDGGVPLPRDGALLGHLFESLVALSVRVYAQAAEARVFHLRTMGGRNEVDLIVERGDRRVVAIEVKLGRVVEDDDVAHLRWLRGEIGDDLLDAIVVHTGPDAYRRPDGIGVVPLALLGA
jgi:predicted AAA+ superfamily ATPase